MSAFFFGLLLVACYMVIGLGLLRVLRVYLDWRDARLLAEWNAQCMTAEAEARRCKR